MAARDGRDEPHLGLLAAAGIVRTRVCPRLDDLRRSVATRVATPRYGRAG